MDAILNHVDLLANVIDLSCEIRMSIVIVALHVCADGLVVGETGACRTEERTTYSVMISIPGDI